MTKQKIGNALKKMGKKYLKQPYKDQWSPERPTTGIVM